jgi:hypothetical protein
MAHSINNKPFFQKIQLALWRNEVFDIDIKKAQRIQKVIDKITMRENENFYLLGYEADIIKNCDFLNRGEYV